MEVFTMVLEDDLAKELCNFKTLKNYDDKIVERILHYYKAPVLFSLKYMQKYYDAPTLSAIMAGGDIKLSEKLEQLSANTLYKIIPSKTKKNFPYVNIFEDKIENNFSATFVKNEERIKAKEHFKALLHTAKSLFIYDKYLKNSFKKIC